MVDAGRRQHDLLPTHSSGRPGQNSGPTSGSCSMPFPSMSSRPRCPSVADVAQFTPKTVETAEERQKLTFRIDPALSSKAHVSATSRPVCWGWLTCTQAEWPVRLQVRLPE